MQFFIKDKTVLFNFQKKSRRTTSQRTPKVKSETNGIHNLSIVCYHFHISVKWTKVETPNHECTPMLTTFNCGCRFDNCIHRTDRIVAIHFRINF